MISLLELSKVTCLLCIGAHPDDIEIGAGGTIMRLIDQQPGLQIRWLVLAGADPTRAREARQSASKFTEGTDAVQVDIHEFKDGYLPWQGDQIKSVFEDLKRDFSPDLILTHYRDDLHQDHRVISELTWNTWRNHGILEYEIIKWDGDLGRPNLYIPLDQTVCQRKVGKIYDSFVSQQSRSWFRKETFLALMRLRGVECNSEYAEAFHVRKIVW